MLNDSGSPHNDLQKLLAWRSLPETQEVLRYLQDKAEAAQAGANKGPLQFSVNGERPDMTVIRALQDRFQGNREGCRELERLLKERQMALEQLIAEQKQAEEERHATR